MTATTTPEAMPPIQSYALLAEKSGRPIITLERRGGYNEDRWAIVDSGFCLSSDGLVFIVERQPSSRTEEFFKTTRFKLAEALALWREYLIILPQEKPWLTQIGFAYGQSESPEEPSQTA